jgi:hypothetical protein
MGDTSSTNETGVLLPVFPLVSGEIAKLVEVSGTITPTSTDEFGEYFGMSLIRVEPAGTVSPDSIIVIPLVAAVEDETFDFTFIAATPLMFVQLHDRPQPFRTYGRCVAYSAGVTERLLAIGERIRFPSLPQYIVAKRDLEVAVRENRGVDATGLLEDSPRKRQCVRPLGEDGEFADDTVRKI